MKEGTNPKIQNPGLKALALNVLDRLFRRWDGAGGGRNAMWQGKKCEAAHCGCDQNSLQDKGSSKTGIK